MDGCSGTSGTQCTGDAAQVPCLLRSPALFLLLEWTGAMYREPVIAGIRTFSPFFLLLFSFWSYSLLLHPGRRSCGLLGRRRNKNNNNNTNTNAKANHVRLNQAPSAVLFGMAEKAVQSRISDEVN